MPESTDRTLRIKRMKYFHLCLFSLLVAIFRKRGDYGWHWDRSDDPCIDPTFGSKEAWESAKLHGHKFLARKSRKP